VFFGAFFILMYNIIHFYYIFVKGFFQKIPEEFWSVFTRGRVDFFINKVFA